MHSFRALIFVFAVIFSNFAFAQSEDLAPIRKELDTWRLELSRIEASSTRAGTNPQKHVADLIEALEPLTNTPRSLDEKLAPMLQNATSKLSQLGEAPKDGKVEDVNVAQDRQTLDKEVRTLNDLQKQVRLYETETSQLLGQLRDKKRELATQYLFAKSEGVLNVSALIRNFSELVLHAISLSRISFEAFQVLLGAFSWKLGVMFGVCVLAIITIPIVKAKALHKLIAARTNYLAHMPHIWAVLSIFITTLIPVVGTYLCVEFALQLKILPGRFPAFVEMLPILVGLMAFARALRHIVFAPRDMERALLAMPSLSEQKVLAKGIKQLFGLHAIAMFISISRVLAEPSLEALSALRLLYCGSALAIFALFFIYLGKAEDIRAAEAIQNSPIYDEDTVHHEAPPQKWVLLIRPVLAGLFLTISIALIMGYFSFAQYVLVQASIGFVLLIGIKMLLRIIEEIIQPFLSPNSFALRKISRTTGVPENTFVQGATLASGITQLLVLVLGGLLIVSLWSGDSDRLLSTLGDTLTGFKIGNLTISFSAIVQAIAVFIGLLFAWKLVQRWVNSKLIANLPLESGLKDSLDILFGYGGMIVACLMAFSSLGISLDNLAVIAGALSVGIGFGLQSIVNNFVSGLILLAERPIKIGDWIVVGADEGHVRKIKVRSTEIETFDKATVIIPNSTLISGNVKNWMHNNIQGRAKIKFKITPDSDPEQVKDILLACAKKHPKVMKDPVPTVYFVDIDGGSLVLELSFLVANVDLSYTVRSELRLAIAKAFREESIKFA